MFFVNLYCQFEPIQTAGNSLENMQTIPGIFFWSRCPVFASIELSTMNNQIQVCGSQCNCILFLDHLHLALLLTQQNSSGKIQTVIRLLPIREKSSEPSLPSLYVLCNLSDPWLQHVLHMTGSHVLHWSGSATPLLDFDITYFCFRWGQYFISPLKMGALPDHLKMRKAVTMLLLRQMLHKSLYYSLHVN